PHARLRVRDLFWRGAGVDAGVGRRGILLRGVRPVGPRHMPGELGDRDVHPQADAEIRNAPLARDAARENLSFPSTRAEAARYEDAVGLVELCGRFLERHPLRVDPADPDFAPVVEPGML